MDVANGVPKLCGIYEAGRMSHGVCKTHKRQQERGSGQIWDDANEEVLARVQRKSAAFAARKAARKAAAGKRGRSKAVGGKKRKQPSKAPKAKKKQKKEKGGPAAAAGSKSFRAKISWAAAHISVVGVAGGDAAGAAGEVVRSTRLQRARARADVGVVMRPDDV